MNELDTALEYARDHGLTEKAVAQTIRAEVDRRRFTEQPDGAVTLAHPDAGEQTVHPDAVPEWERYGWTRKPEPEAAVAEDEPEDEELTS